VRNRWRGARFFGMVRASLLEGSLRRRLLTAFAAASFALALCASGCSGQGEGERCDINDDNTGDSDCASGLQCYAAATLGGVAETDHTDLCCPINRTQATTSICSIAPSPPGGNPAPPDGGADTGVTTEGGTADAPSDSPPDSPNDSPLDSPADAPLDSPAD
jgi:hypothetical protein